MRPLPICILVVSSIQFGCSRTVDVAPPPAMDSSATSAPITPESALGATIPEPEPTTE
jgi:hypothetical protein